MAIVIKIKKCIELKKNYLLSKISWNCTTKTGSIFLRQVFTLPIWIHQEFILVSIFFSMAKFWVIANKRFDRIWMFPWSLDIFIENFPTQFKKKTREKQILNTFHEKNNSYTFDLHWKLGNAFDVVNGREVLSVLCCWVTD